MTISGTAANTLTGPTIVEYGTLALAKPDTVYAFAGPLTIGDGTDNAHVALQANEQIAPTAIVTIAQNGDLRLNGFNETVGRLQSNLGEGAVGNFSSTASTLCIGGSGSSTFGGSILDGGSAPLTLAMTGSATLVLCGINSYSGGTMVEGGTLELTNSAALPDGISLTIGANATSVFGGAATPVGASNAVPEPTMLALIGFGAIGIAIIASRQRKQVSP